MHACLAHLSGGKKLAAGCVRGGQRLDGHGEGGAAAQAVERAHAGNPIET